MVLNYKEKLQNLQQKLVSKKLQVISKRAIKMQNKKQSETAIFSAKKPPFLRFNLFFMEFSTLICMKQFTFKQCVKPIRNNKNIY